MQNEKELVEWAMLSILVLNMALAIFGYYTAQGLAIGNPSIAQLQGIEKGMGTAGSNLAQSICSQSGTINVTNPNPCPFQNTGTFGYFAPILNFIFSIVGFIVNLVLFLLTDIFSILLITFVIIPSFLSVSLGAGLGYLFTMIYVVGMAILGFYAFFILRSIIQSR